jgi:hypothetical protein
MKQLCNYERTFDRNSNFFAKYLKDFFPALSAVTTVQDWEHALHDTGNDPYEAMRILSNKFNPAGVETK